MEKNNRKAISSMASDTDHRTAYDSHLHSDVFFYQPVCSCRNGESGRLHDTDR